MKDYGIKLAINMIRKLATGGMHGVNFCTLNLEKSVQLVLEGLQWTGHYDDHHPNKLINVSALHSTQKIRSWNPLDSLDGRPQALGVRDRSDDIGP